MIHTQGVGSVTPVGRIGFVFFQLAALFFKTRASPVGGQFNEDVTQDDIFNELDLIEGHSSPAIPNNLGSTSNYGSTSFLLGTTGDSSLGLHTPGRPGAPYFQDRTTTNYAPTLLQNTHHVNYHEDDLNHQDCWLAELLNSDFDWADIQNHPRLMAAEPGFTGVHDSVNDSFSWEHQPFSAKVGPNFAIVQESDSFRQRKDDLGYQSHDTKSPHFERIPGHISAHTTNKRERKGLDEILAQNTHSDIGVVLRRKLASHQKHSVWLTVAEHVGKLHETFALYCKRELSGVESQPFDLLEDGNFQSQGKEAPNFFIESSILDQETANESISALSWYLRNYESSYKPAPIKRSSNDVNLNQRQTYRLKDQQMKSHFYVLYLAAYRRFSHTGLDSRIDAHMTKWVDHMKKCYRKHKASHVTAEDSWSRTITFTATSVLYQIELMYRLSTPMDKMLEDARKKSLRTALESLENWWLNFPYFDDMPKTLLKSNEFYSETVFDDIKRLRKDTRNYENHLELSAIFLSNWFSKKNCLTFERIKMRKKQKLIPEASKVLQDCAWIDFFSISTKELQD